MAEILKGAPVANAITEDLVARAEKLRTRGIDPCLAILRVGERPEDLTYERGILKRCEKVGIRVLPVLLPDDCTQATLTEAIEKINGDAGIHGCLLFRPLPPHLDGQAAAEAVLHLVWSSESGEWS